MERTRLRKQGWDSAVAPGQPAQGPCDSPEEAVEGATTCLGGTAALARIGVKADLVQDWVREQEGLDIAPM
eukprot:1677980-Lingulodinium_polyedra.AAC.1